MSQRQGGPAFTLPADVNRRRIALHGHDEAGFEALLFEPRNGGELPAVVIGAEGTGANSFIERVGSHLAHQGLVALVIDPYRFDGPPDPEAYEDYDTVMSYISALDFVRATHDVLTGIEHLRSLPNVDPDRVATWGYCTGATLAGLAACVDQRLRAAVLFYPSQPAFDVLSDRTPAHLMDVLWAISARTLVLYGDQDVVMPPERLAEMRRRLEMWHVKHELVVYEGAGHAFCSESPGLFQQRAADDGWAKATEFIADALR